MAYFTNFPQVLYGSPEAYSIIKDISLKFSILPIVIQSELSWFDIVYQDHQTMEDLAQDYYGDPTLYWVIMVMNGIIDPFYDLPLRYNELQEFIDSKYPGTEKYDAHHYTADGIFVNADYPGAKAVSNESYETTLNDSKRQIKMMDPVYIPTIINNLRGLL